MFPFTAVDVVSQCRSRGHCGANLTSVALMLLLQCSVTEMRRVVMAVFRGNTRPSQYPSLISDIPAAEHMTISDYIKTGAVDDNDINIRSPRHKMIACFLITNQRLAFLCGRHDEDHAILVSALTHGSLAAN